MEKHPIEGLMATTINGIKEMVDVNTIVGDAVETKDGTVIIPISKVSFGFATGGGEFQATENSKEENFGTVNESQYPFAGGTGAGISINPIAFMVVGQGQIRLLPVTINSSIDKILDVVPQLLEKASDIIKKQCKDEKTESV